MRVWLVLALLLARAAALTCNPGFYFWERDGLQHCRLCPPGCACPGGVVPCFGCSGGVFSPGPGAVICTPCPPGTTSDWIFNAGCDPFNFQQPCANGKGPLGQSACRPAPPPTQVNFTAPGGALVFPPQYLPGGPPFDPNRVPPYYDINNQPMVQQSY